MIVFGDTCVDLIVTGTDVVPRFGHVEKWVDDYMLEMGGSCCLFACRPPSWDCGSGCWDGSAMMGLAAWFSSVCKSPGWTQST